MALTQKWITDVDELCALAETGLLWRQPLVGPAYRNDGITGWTAQEILTNLEYNDASLITLGAGFFILLEE